MVSALEQKVKLIGFKTFKLGNEIHYILFKLYFEFDFVENC